MPDVPLLSLIVPTRKRPALLRTFLNSVAATASAPQTIEVVLVIDSDDPESMEVSCPSLGVRRVVVRPGQTMGGLNAAGYEASRGRYLMLLNDDVVVRTQDWDLSLRTCFARCPDEILLVHVNDRLFETIQCTFPVLSRRFCQLAGGVCPTDYVRYRIDDHVEDVFNLLGVLGERRTIYLPDVVFEHGNYAEEAGGARRYRCDPLTLAVDAERFTAFFPQRKELALWLMEVIHGSDVKAEWKSCLEASTDSFALRVPRRLRVVWGTGTALREESARRTWLRTLAHKLHRRCVRLLARLASRER